MATPPESDEESEPSFVDLFASETYEDVSNLKSNTQHHLNFKSKSVYSLSLESHGGRNKLRFIQFFLGFFV